VHGAHTHARIPAIRGKQSTPTCLPQKAGSLATLDSCEILAARVRPRGLPASAQGATTPAKDESQGASDRSRGLSAADRAVELTIGMG
jgi:hypothetical protein